MAITKSQLLENITNNMVKKLEEQLNLQKARKLIKECNARLKTLKALDEAMNYQYEDGATPPTSDEGNQQLERDVQTQNNGTGTTKFIDDIRVLALSAMKALARQSQSPEFKTINTIFDQCQKYENSLAKNVEATPKV
jgi:hypothetical protein